MKIYICRAVLLDKNVRKKVSKQAKQARKHVSTPHDKHVNRQARDHPSTPSRQACQTHEHASTLAGKARYHVNYQI